MPYFALLDDALNGHAYLYTQYVDSHFIQSGALKSIDDNLQQGWTKGLHAVLMADYEFGQPLLNLPQSSSGCLTIHWFEQRCTVDAATWLNQHTHHEPSGISTPLSSTSKPKYLDDIHHIHEAIRRGETYQINYTTRLHLHAYGCPIHIYRQLRQPVPYAALMYLPNIHDEKSWTLSFSPELFLKIDSDGLITTEPMKGTAPILNDGYDQQRGQALQADPKNRAENIMIVDLLRNDLGKIAQTGQVRVPEPFKVSRFGSVWQMTTAIEAQAQAHIRVADIFQATFPCGSITGAPKRMSMHIINQLEKEKRGLYTGSIGFLNPCATGLGFEGVLNVVIRTLSLQNISDGLYQGVYGVGSGIVIDSDAQAEYEECKWKAHFLTQLRPHFGIFETMLIENKQCTLLNLHLGRLKQSAHALNLILPSDFVQKVQSYILSLPNATIRLKINLDKQGLSFSHTPINKKLPPLPHIIISPKPLANHDYLRRFKTTHRQPFDDAWQTAEQQGAFDSLLFNSDGYLIEGGRSNVFIKINQQWHTPSLDLDILNGVMRQTIFNNPQKYLETDHIIESKINLKMVENAEKIYLSNALRGVFEVALK